MKISHSSLARTLQDRETTKAGAEYNPRETVWRIVPFTFDWGKFEPYFEDWIIESVKIATVRLLKRLAVVTAHKSFSNLLDCAKSNFDAESGLMSQITEAHVRVYLARCRENINWHESYVRVLQSLLTFWHNLKLPGLDPQIIPWLKSIKLKSPPRGVNVRVMDPTRGIYSDLERKNIDRAISDGFASGEMLVEHHVLCCLVKLYGQRPVQYSYIKLKDFKRKIHDGEKRLCLDIPMGKGRRNLASQLRAEFLPEKVIPRDLEQIIIAYVYQIIQKYKRLLKENKISKRVEIPELPLFPGWLRGDYEPGLTHHCDSKMITKKIKRALGNQKVMSEAGKDLRVNLTRFRHTVTSGYCAEGYSDWWIAAAMGWRSTDSIKSYREITAQMVRKMTKDDAIALAPFYQAFNGTLKTKRSDVKQGSVKSHDLDIDHGDCAKNKFCGALIPYACYTCKLFEPWDDVGVHMEFLDFLLAMRNDQLETDANGNALLSKSYVATVHDLTICACAEVVSDCIEKRRIDDERGS